MKRSLNEGWLLLQRDLDVTAKDILGVMEAQDFLEAGDLPLDAHMPLIEHGIIKDPVVADYSYDCEWMERKSWWFKKDFELSQCDLNTRAIRVELESLDLFADIFINGRWVGEHQSCHYPFIAEVKECLTPGRNSLIVRLTMGPERVNKDDYEYLSDYICTEIDGGRGDRGEKARAMLRKPQYVYGWDWGPRVGTVGIVKNAFLYILGDVAVTRVSAVTLNTEQNARMRFEVEFESLRPVSTQEAVVTIEVKHAGKTVRTMECSVLAESGANYTDFETVIKDAQLWWPNGAGDQPMYEVQATVKTGNCTAVSEPARFGIRTVALDLAKHADNDRRFAFAVNGVTIYAKGGDWIPSDSIYARVSLEKYQTLLGDAKDCNFNMIRIWGGGNYERDEFYELCDEHGILIWHDFMFACSLYPDDQAWFRHLVTHEIEYQTKRLRNHPSMALWCGNNECQWAFEGYFDNPQRAYSGGLHLYNEIMPRIVRNNCPEIPYWRSSPYGGERTNDNQVGDRHQWHDCTMSERMEDRINPEAYDRVTSRFVSEYGYIGPCSEETITKYCGGKQWTPGDRVWNLHNNTFEKATVPEGIRRHYADPEPLAIKDYLQYGRLVQGLMYGYSLEAIRFYPKNDGALFWMYTDTWGEVGWTIIDYYLDRKPSFYYVKRAFAPVKLILRASDDRESVRVMGVNDTPDKVKTTITFGFAGFDGTYDTASVSIVLKPFGKGIVHEFPMPARDKREGMVFARIAEAPLALLRQVPFRDLLPHKGRVHLASAENSGSDLLVTLISEGYCHAVSLGFPAGVRLSDEYFDMLPGDRATVTVYGKAGKKDDLMIQWL